MQRLIIKIVLRVINFLKGKSFQKEKESPFPFRKFLSEGEGVPEGQEVLK